MINFSSLIFALMIATAPMTLFSVETTSTKVEEELPNPIKLKSTWSDYFKVEGESYSAHVQELKAELEEITAHLEGEQKEQALSLIKRLLANLEAYPQVKQEVLPEPVAKPYLDAYTLNQQVELSKQISFFKTSLENQKKEISVLKKRIANTTTHLDKIILNYQDIQENTYQKMMSGLELMNTRVSLWINKEKLRISEEKKQLLEVQVQQTEDEILYARSHFSQDGLSVEAAKEELAKSRHVLEEARTNTLNIDLRALPTYPDTPEGQLKGSIQQLTELNYAIKEIGAELHLVFQNIKLALAEATQSDAPNSATDLSNQLADWNTQITSIKGKIKECEIKNEEELNRLQRIAPDENESKEIEKLKNHRISLGQENSTYLSQLDGTFLGVKTAQQQIDQLVKKNQSTASRVYDQTSETLSGFFTAALSWYNTPLFKIGEQPITAQNLIKAILVIVVAYFLSHYIQRLITKTINRQRGVSKGFTYSINRLIHYTILLIGAIIALGSLGLDSDRITLVISALSVGIGFGLQSVVNNFVSGLIILFSRNISVGDYIELNTGQWGNVSAINVQNTIIHTREGLDVIIPNSNLLAEKYTNWTRHDPYRRIKVRFGVAYGSDKDKVAEAACSAAQKVPATVGTAEGLADPSCWLVEFGQSELIFELVVWIHINGKGNHGSIQASYFWELDTALREYGIEIPFPIRDIRITERHSGVE